MPLSVTISMQWFVISSAKSSRSLVLTFRPQFSSPFSGPVPHQNTSVNYTSKPASLFPTIMSSARAKLLKRNLASSSQINQISCSCDISRLSRDMTWVVRTVTFRWSHSQQTIFNLGGFAITSDNGPANTLSHIYLR